MSYCPTLLADVPSPGPRKVGGGCIDCREDLDERAAILQYGEGTGGANELPECATREDADALSRSQALASMRGQRSLA